MLFAVGENAKNFAFANGFYYFIIKLANVTLVGFNPRSVLIHIFARIHGDYFFSVFFSTYFVVHAAP